SWGESVGANQGGSLSTVQGASVSHSQGVSSESGQSSNWSAGSSEGTSQSLGASANVGGGGTLGIPGVASLGANVGSSVNAGVGASQGLNQSVGGGTSSSTGMSSGISTGHSESVSQGATWGTSSGVNVGGSQSVGISQGTNAGVSGGESFGVSQSAGHSLGTSASLAQSSGSSQSSGVSVGGSESVGVSQSTGQSVGASESWGQSASVSQAAGSSVGGSQSTGVSAGQSAGTSQSVGGSAGTSSSTGSSSGTSQSVGGGAGTTASTGTSQAQSNSVGGSAGRSASVANATGRAVSSGVSSSTAHSQGGFNSTTNSESWGTADSVGWADSRGSADSVGTNRGWFEATSRSQAVTRGVSDTESWSESVSESWSEGRALSRSRNWGRAHSDGSAAGQAIALGAGRGFVGGFSAGMVPGVSIARSWQTEDDVAIRLTEIARSLESLLNQASMEGGFLTSALLLVGDRGERAAQALIPQAFHGPAMPTPVLTVPGDESLRTHALAFRPSLTPEANPFAVPLLWSRWGTLLTPGMLAAYTAPNLFEEGTTVTVQEKLPPLAFYSEQKGEVVLGHLVSPETGDLTAVPLKLSRERYFHTAFCGDTGYGKSVAAERLVYETTLHWKLKTIVLDFGAGWRKLMNAPGLQGRVEIRQLSPGGVRPLRWNPLQIGRNILPEVQWRAFCDIFGSIAKLGQRRQVHELRDALRRVYLDAGVLVDDPECRSDPQWGYVRDEELSDFSAQLSDADGEPVGAGTPLSVLNAESRQLIAVYRSKTVGLATLYREIEEKLRTVPPRDSMLRGVLEGILFRLHPLVQGAAAVQYAAGAEAIDLNEIVPGGPGLYPEAGRSSGLAEGRRSELAEGWGTVSAEERTSESVEGWGVAVLEGGAFLDDFSKAFLLGWAAWHLYTDAVILRMQRGATRPAHMQIVFEEANKILAGLDSTSSEDESGQSTAEQFANMWRDSRKYGIWLHLITQSPSLIPPGILSSCNNIFVSQLKNPKDRDLAIAALHRSEKGFVDEAWRRFLASLPVARSVAKLGYSFERAEVEPTYIQPLMLEAQEPTDGEIGKGRG
ncbi:MAG: ATP-binding protein, partial [Chloroflexi bacterium]|nr:ATP-binding protein [Chloroflexota bacterium]